MALLKSVKVSRKDDKNAIKKAKAQTTQTAKRSGGSVATKIQQAVA